MQDLDIRGAGNLLGAEQSGFIADLGYETYQKILSQAVAELKNDEFANLYADEPDAAAKAEGDAFVDECNVECDLRAFFPETYVPGSSERMLLYRELDSIDSDEALEQFRRRMEDRFGPMTEEGKALLQIVPLRRLGRRAGVERLILKNGKMILMFVHSDSPFYKSTLFDRILNYATANFRRCKMQNVGERLRMSFADVPSVAEALKVMQEMVG